MDLLYEEESYKIRGAIFDVYQELGCSHKEVVYQKAVHQSFLNQGLKIEKEKRLPVIFRSVSVGVYVPDFIVNGEIIIELKAKPFMTKQDMKQFWHYLKGTEYKLGFLVNFGQPAGVKIIRRVYDIARNSSA